MPFPETYLDIAGRAFGSPNERIESVSARASTIFDRPVIVWEGDAQTFAFTYVSASAESLLGYPCRRWTSEATFWADVVVHPEDRDDAIGYCALATGKCVDHAFVYRARTMDGRVVWLADYVQVVRGARGLAVRLRGIMIDVTAETVADAPSARWRHPPRPIVEQASP